MRINFNRLLILLGFVTGLSSCLDHRLGGALSPARFRLKSYSDGTGTTTYTYDAQNQPSTITRNGVTSTIMYGDPQRLYAKTDTGANHIFYITPSSSDPVTGTAIVFPPVLNGTNFTAPQRSYSRNLGGIIYGSSFTSLYYDYGFDAAKRLISYTSRADAPQIDSYGYSYTGDNITTESIATAAGHGTIGTATYTYDDKINPFYGLLDPLVNPRLRFTRNNILTGVTVNGKTGNTGSILYSDVYTYEYNAQNLPTKRTLQSTITGNSPTTSVTTFTYESY